MEDCFDKILKASTNSEVSKYKILIELMKDLENEISNALRVRNCLLFLINLCFKQDYPDYIHNIGKKAKKLSEVEKCEMRELLRAEFNN